MAGTTDFVPFATATGAHVTAQATYIAEATTGTGFVPGVASSYDCNKVWRQASFVAAGVATYVANELGINVADDGNLTNFVTNLTNAIQVPISAAQTNAEAYAATVAGAAQTAAETYALTQANNAQSNAEVYAASQASAAQTNAENFASTQATNARTAAETYAASVASSAQTNAEIYAASVASTAQSNSEAYALTKANAAQSAAETYANGTVNLAPTYMREKLPGGGVRISGSISLTAGANIVEFPAGGFPTVCVTVDVWPFGKYAEAYPTSKAATYFTCNVGITETYFYEANGY